MNFPMDEFLQNCEQILRSENYYYDKIQSDLNKNYYNI